MMRKVVEAILKACARLERVSVRVFPEENMFHTFRRPQGCVFQICTYLGNRDTRLVQ